jgi:hypothetical protein
MFLVNSIGRSYRDAADIRYMLYNSSIPSMSFGVVVYFVVGVGVGRRCLVVDFVDVVGRCFLTPEHLRMQLKDPCMAG